MATTYKILDAQTNVDGNYLVTVRVNDRATGNQVFTVTAQNPDAKALRIGLLADVAAFLLASGASLAAVQTPTYTVN
jgi:hypothetical protein